MALRARLLGALFLCSGVLAALQGCVGDDPGTAPVVAPEAGTQAAGELGQPCRSDGTCSDPLVCDRGICLAPSDASAKDATVIDGTVKFNPATLPLTGWWRAGYSASPWVGEVGGDLAEGASPPAAGAAVNGLTPAEFDGVDDQLSTSADWSSYVSGTAGTVLVLFRAESAAAVGTDNYDDPSLVSDTSYGFNLGFSEGGLGVAFYDTDWRQPARVPCTAGAWHLAKVRWDGASLEYGVDRNPMTRVTTGPLSSVATTKLRIGAVLISKQGYFHGKMLEVMLAKSVLSDGDISNVRSYCNGRYGLAL